MQMGNGVGMRYSDRMRNDCPDSTENLIDRRSMSR